MTGFLSNKIMFVRKALRKATYGQSFLSGLISKFFHRFYYYSGEEGQTWKKTTWFGVPAQKCPFDMWVYQEILFETKPDFIIETGTADGGSALFLGSICDLLQTGHIVSIDIEKKNRPKHPRVTYITGSSSSAEVVNKVKELIREKKRVMVILDSDHSKDHVARELKIYSSFVSVGQYLIVEDTNVNNNPVLPEFGPGPKEAIDDFLKNNQFFVVDKSREKFYVTFNPGGYLRRIEGGVLGSN